MSPETTKAESRKTKRAEDAETSNTERSSPSSSAQWVVPSAEGEWFEVAREEGSPTTATPFADLVRALLGPSGAESSFDDFTRRWESNVVPEAGGQEVIPLANSNLTHRERQIVALVNRGLRNQDIAKKLVISEATVSKHVKNILAKLRILDPRSVG